MAPTGETHQSAIGRAFAGMTESVTIPKPPHVEIGQETYAAIAAKSAPAKIGGLPTPPNSMSPSLGPREVTNSNGPHSPPSFKDLDSETDLEEAVEHAKAQDSPHKAMIGRQSQDTEDSDAFGDITPYMLAKHHLPGILVKHGPLAIRHIMSYLTTSVPGFPGIPPAKARRLVVAALEGRGEDGLVGGLNPQVIFEKVGWGRWSAKKRGQTLRPRPKPTGLQIPQARRAQDRPHSNAPRTDKFARNCKAAQSMPEYDSNRMSLDEDRKPSLGDSDATDEEDWASIGAAALRAGASPFPVDFQRLGKRRQHQQFNASRSKGRGITKRPSTHFAKSLPTSSVLYGVQQQLASKDSMDFSSFYDEDFGAQDREAVEALLRMSSE